MQKGKKEDVFIKQPYYEGGPKELTSFIQSHIIYPEAALLNKVKGVVDLYVTIDHLGQIIESVVTKSIGHGCDEEAQRVAKLVKFTVPKSPRKLKVTFHKHLRVSFVLPKIKVPQDKKPSQQFTYIYTNLNSPVSVKGKEKTIQYTYTVTIKN